MIHLHPYIPCTTCGKKASWSYMPGAESFCDECVHRGCSCTHNFCNEHSKLNGYFENPPADSPNSWKWLKENEIWVSLDEQGREYPCCEFSKIHEDDHKDIAQLDLGWESYYKGHEDKRPSDFNMKVLTKFHKLLDSD